MRLRWKILQFGVFTGLTLLATGCGGFHAKYGVSPLTFLLPGIGKVEPRSANAGNDLQLNEPDRELAQVKNSQIDY